MPILTVMTCGTSLITNEAAIIDKDLPDAIRANANATSWNDINVSDTNKLKDHLETRKA